jgi:hypothetical protein
VQPPHRSCKCQRMQHATCSSCGHAHAAVSHDVPPPRHAGPPRCMSNDEQGRCTVCMLAASAH